MADKTAPRTGQGENKLTNWTNDDFRWLTRRVLELANRSACPVLSVHGGGYQLPVTVATAVEHVRVLANYK